VWRDLLSKVVSRSLEVAVSLGKRIRRHWASDSDGFGYSLAHGSAGLAVFTESLYRGTGDVEWRRASRELLRHAVMTAKHAVDLPAGLFGGVAGLLFASRYISPDSMTSLLGQSLIAMLHEHTSLLLAFGETRSRIPASYVDVIGGLAGIGLVFLNLPRSNSLPLVIASLESRVAVRDGVPVGMFLPAPLIASRHLRAMFPDGMVDAGVAHGVAGPLSLLALAATRGMSVRLSILEEGSEWLVARSDHDRHGAFWYPGYGSANEPPNHGRMSPKNAWCYGVAGIANTLWLCGEACGRTDIKDFAVAAMLAGLARHAGVQEPFLCHGTAALLHITRRFHQRTADSAFVDHIEHLTYQLIRSADAFEPSHSAKGLGLLEGMAGIGIALSGDFDQELCWDRAFALA